MVTFAWIIQASKIKISFAAQSWIDLLTKFSYAEFKIAYHFFILSMVFKSFRKQIFNILEIYDF